jgi:hypothetical protein
VPQKDLNSFPQLIADLYHETSRVVFWCIIGGMAVGALAAAYWVVQFILMAPVHAGFNARLCFVIIPATIVGGIFGCVFGVVFELMIGFIRGPQDQHKKGHRRHRQRQPRSVQPPSESRPTGIQTESSDQGNRDEKNIWRPVD